MANRTLFQTIAGKLIPGATARNQENAPAYALSPKEALAQYAATGCLNGTFYASDAEQLAKVQAFAEQVDATFIAKVAIFSRTKGFMKDMPALLCAILSKRDSQLLRTVFPRVIDNGRMLRNFVQIMRSGATGRKSLGSAPKSLVLKWLEERTDDGIFRDSVGQKPSLADVVKMVHPKPATPVREALYAYLIGQPHRAEVLPSLVRAFEAYKTGESREVPDVPFQMLTALELGTPEWTAIARKAPWQMTRMNLNTFARHGVFEVDGMTEIIAHRLANRQAVEASRVFPYQLLMAYHMVDEKVPAPVREALQTAMEAAVAHVPAFGKKVYVCPDVSGSMASPVTGVRRDSTSAVRCVDVAALVAATILRNNPDAEVIPFETDVVSLRLNPRDSIMTNAAKLASVGGGGTNCNAPLKQINSAKAKGDLVVYVSDNESWVDADSGRGTALMRQWSVFRQRNPSARMVCIDLQPGATTQAPDRRMEILNVGGFSDAVFTLMKQFASGELGADHWIGAIENVEL